MSNRGVRVENLDYPGYSCNSSTSVDVEDQSYLSMWMTEFIDLHVGHEKMSIPWTEREKNLRALRARFVNDA